MPSTTQVFTVVERLEVELAAVKSRYRDSQVQIEALHQQLNQATMI